MTQSDPRGRDFNCSARKTGAKAGHRQDAKEEAQGSRSGSGPSFQRKNGGDKAASLERGLTRAATGGSTGRPTPGRSLLQRAVEAS